MARERNEGIRYYITAYTGDKKMVGKLAEGLFHVTLNEGDSKIVFVMIKMFDEMFSEKLESRDSMEKVENEFREYRKTVAYNCL